MRRSAVPVFVGIAILLSGIGLGTLVGAGPPPVPAKGKQQPDFFPLGLGNKWHMEFATNRATVRATLQVVKVEKIAGRTVARLEQVQMGKSRRLLSR
jgi:hypothetical protein